MGLGLSNVTGRAFLLPHSNARGMPATMREELHRGAAQEWHGRAARNGAENGARNGTGNVTGNCTMGVMI
jgi:hypothetical protein